MNYKTLHRHLLTANTAMVESAALVMAVGGVDRPSCKAAGEGSTSPS